MPPSDLPGTSSPPRPLPAAERLSGLLPGLLREHSLFRVLPQQALDDLVAAARIEVFAAGEVVMDGFASVGTEVYVVLSGQIDVWTLRDRLDEAPDGRLVPGQLFGFSAMLTELSVGPRAVAARPAAVAALPAELVAPIFASPQGARFLAEQGAEPGPPDPRQGAPVYQLVDDLIVTKPLIVEPEDQAADVARWMSERGVPCAAVALPGGRFGLIDDAVLRQRVIVEGRPGTVPAGDIMDVSFPTAFLGDSAAEAYILLLDREAEFLLVTDRNRRLRGVVTPRDFVVSPTTAGVSLHEQMRRVTSIDELHRRAKQVPSMLAGLLSRGMASPKVIAVYSSILDTIVRRALVLTFDAHPELSLDAFTWLSLGSNGRREATLSSDIDSAVTFDDSLEQPEIDRYRAVFTEVDKVLADCGLLGDEHGATASRKAFARTNASWRAAALEWLAAPADNKGAIMTSLLVDGRPIHGDPGLPAAAAVFGDLRSHPGTMRLLLQESLSRRAKLRSVRDIFSWPETFDLKGQAMLPIVNIARWSALSVGSAALPTVERLKEAGGSTMLPDQQAQTLIEVFEVLQRLRLRHQLAQFQHDEAPSDLLTKDRMSPIDRSVVAQAVREIASVQKRMDHISTYVPAEAWTAPAQP